MDGLENDKGLEVNVEEIMTGVRAIAQEESPWEREPDCLFDQEIDVAGIMRDIRRRITDSEKIDSLEFENMDEAGSQLRDIYAEIARMNSFAVNTRAEADMKADPGCVIPVALDRPGFIQKIVTMIKRLVRKATRFLMLDQKAYNEKMSACIKALCESQEQVLRLTELVAMLMSDQARVQSDAVNAARRLDELYGLTEKQIKFQADAINAAEKWSERLAVLEQNISTAAEAAQSTAGALETEKEHVRRWQDDRDTKIQAMARDVIRAKWAFRDYVDDLKDAKDSVVRCCICGYSGEAAKLEKKTSECIFDGGKLVRYVCPECGGIFGPTKFSALSKEAQDDDYTVHYTGYHEGDSTDKEMKTFMRLEPTKDGVYLNYGCGSWSQTMQKLHDLGYCVYGFEPYSRDINNPYIISDRAVLSKMRFNGIFSNDVLEHMADPVADISFMKSLLATPDALMAHTTGCYGYKYEYTRFHVFFFTGNSLNVLCEKAGLKLIEVSDAESEVGEQDFHCRIFGRKETEIDYLPMACVNAFAEASASEICLHPDGVCFGPYITLPAGKYTLHVHMSGNVKQGKVPFSITADEGKTSIMGCDIPIGRRDISFEILPHHKDVEFVFRNLTQEDIRITKLALS